MKRTSLFLIIFLLFTLVGCMEKDDYYNKEEIDSKIDAIRPSIEERYFNEVLSPTLLAGEMNFIELGDTARATVDEWDYGYIVVELDAAQKVEINLEVVAPYGDWDVNIYFDDLNDPDLTFEEVESGDKYIVTFHDGFNTIEIDSYADYSVEFTISVLESTDNGDSV